MSETRYDWLADRWVIFAPRRNQRPDQFATSPPIAPDGETDCPFCIGRESETPASVLTLPAGRRNRKKWLVRVVPNKFPALQRLQNVQGLPLAMKAIQDQQAEDSIGIAANSSRVKSSHQLNNRFAKSPQHLNGSGQHRLHRPDDDEYMDDKEFNHAGLHEVDADHFIDSSQHPLNGHAVEHTDACVLFRSRQICGAHEVFIETPDHQSSLTMLDDNHTYLVFDAFRQRLNYWRAHNALHYAVIFKNVGYDAGASLVHTHSQLITANFVPPDVLRSCQRMKQYSETYHRGYFSDIIEQELEAEIRVIKTTKNFVVIAPYASFLPFTIRILPRVAAARFEDIGDKMLREFALLSREVLHSLETILPGAAYNFVLYTSPFKDYWDNVFHWRMELFPRLTRVAGFEWGSDCFINPILPENSAARMRAQLQQQTAVG